MHNFNSIARVTVCLFAFFFADNDFVSGQTIQFMPVRLAPLGSPVGTVGVH